MKEILKQLHKICVATNDKFDGEIVNQKDLDDFVKVLDKDWDNSFEQFKNGIQILASNLDTIQTTSDPNYVKGILDTFWGLRWLNVLINDADDLLTCVNKGFLYKSGEITLKEYQASDEIVLEDENDGETFGI